MSRDITLTFEIDLETENRRFVGRRDKSGDPLGSPTITIILHWNKTRGHLQFSSIEATARSGEPLIYLKRLGPQRILGQIPALELDRSYNNIGELSFGSLQPLIMEAINSQRLLLNAFDFFSLFDLLNRTLNKIHHVGPLRDMPERAYRTDQISLPGGSTRNALGLLFHNMTATSAVNRALCKLGMARSMELTTPAPGYAGISIAEFGSLSRRANPTGYHSTLAHMHQYAQRRHPAEPTQSPQEQIAFRLTL